MKILPTKRGKNTLSAFVDFKVTTDAKDCHESINELGENVLRTDYQHSDTRYEFSRSTSNQTPILIRDAVASHLLLPSGKPAMAPFFFWVLASKLPPPAGRMLVCDCERDSK